MDNFRGKGGYSNFNNNNIRNNNIRDNNRSYAGSPNGAESYKRKYNIVSNNKNAPKRNPNNNIKKQVGSMYGNICNTMQKKFNMTLYKNQGEDSNNVNMNKNRFNIIDNKSSLDRNNQQRVRYNRNFNGDMKNDANKTNKKSTIFKEIGEDDNSIGLDEGQQEIPKWVFVFITIALVVAAVLMWRTMQQNDKSMIKEDNGSTIASQLDASGDDSELNVSGDFDEEGILAGDDEDADEDVAGNEDSSKLNKVSASESNKDSVQTVNTTTNKQTTGKDNTAESTKKPTSTKKPVSDNSTQNNDSTQDETEEDDEIIEEEEKVKIKLDVTGDLYRCSSMYGIFGSDRFNKYTSFTNDTFGVQVLKKDLSGIWLDVKNSKVVDYVGYSSSGRVPVYKITVKSVFDTKVMYALSGASVQLPGVRYKEENGSAIITSPMKASKDIVLIEY